MATIGYRAAVADAFGMKVTGLIAYVMWMFVHMLYLIGWGNRLGTIYTWLRALVFSKNRGHRIITFEQASDRLQEDVPHTTSSTRAILPRSDAEGVNLNPTR
jgi:NADH:ubiquinone reductase (H+-translocating)